VLLEMPENDVADGENAQYYRRFKPERVCPPHVYLAIAHNLLGRVCLMDRASGGASCALGDYPAFP
jgi:hypothetical protein